MDPNRQLLGNAEDRSKPVYFNKPNDDLRNHTQMYPPKAQQSMGKEQQCLCMSVAGNTMCNGCRNTTLENNWKNEHSVNPDYRIRDTKASLQESSMYSNAFQQQHCNNKKVNDELGNAKSYWPQNKHTYPDDLIITSKKIIPTHLDRNKPPLVSSNNYPAETNYHYEQHQQQQRQQTNDDEYYKDRCNYDEKYQLLKDDAAARNTKIGYIPEAPTSTAIYNINNQSTAIKMEPTRTSLVDHQSNVVNPSNMLAAKEQQPSPNYARKCPPIFSNVEHNSCHSNLYVLPPQFSSEKFATNSSTQLNVYRQSPVQEYRPYDSPSTLSHLQLHADANVKRRDSPMQTSAIMSPYHATNQNSFTPRNELTASSPQGPTRQSPYAINRGNASYYTPPMSKVDTPEMSPIIMKQTPHTHYQYSKSPLHSTPSSHMMLQKYNPRLVEDNVVKKEDDHFELHAGVINNRNIYINPYNPSPKSDACCAERSSPYASSKVTALCEDTVTSRSYTTKYNKISMTAMSTNKSGGGVNVNVNVNMNINTPHHHQQQHQQEHQQQQNLALVSLQQQQQQQQSNTSMYRNSSPYYNYENQSLRYESNAHNLSSPALAAATATLPMPTTSQQQQQQQQKQQQPQATIHHMYAPQSQMQPPHQNQQQQQQHHMQHMEQYPSLQQLQQHSELSRSSSATNIKRHDISLNTPQYNLGPIDVHEQQQNPSSRNPRIHQMNMHKMQAISSSTQQPLMAMPTTIPTPIANTSTQLSTTPQSTNKTKTQATRPNYRELINHAYAIRNATSEEELNLQIIKKTLNVDAHAHTQIIRPPPPTTSTGVTQPPTVPIPVPVPTAVKSNTVEKLHYAPAAGPISTVRYTQEVAVPSNRPQVSNVSLSQPLSVGYSQQNVNRSDLSLPIADSATKLEPYKLQKIKQEDKVPAFSPLDLSMRTVKTKADSTEYPQQKNHMTMTHGNMGSKYSLPRVNFTPNFSLHSNDHQQQATAITTGKVLRNLPVKQEKRTEESSTLRYDAQFNSPRSTKSSMGTQNALPFEPPPAPLPFNKAQQYFGSKNSTVAIPIPIEIKSNSLPPKPAPPAQSIIGQGVFQSRPSVLEANPYASHKLQKKECKNLHLPHNILAVEQLPPDTSIMPLPKIKYESNTQIIGKTGGNDAIKTTAAQPTQTAYSIACERNPNFLGRKRHLHEYASLKYNEPVNKQVRYQTEPPPSTSSSSSLMLESASAKMINNNNQECKSTSPVTTAEKPIQAEVPNTLSNVASVSSTNIVICKKEPITPTTTDVIPITIPTVKSETTSLIAARIRTKAELKGFTFNAAMPVETTNAIPVPEDVKIKVEPIQPENMEVANIAGLAADEKNENSGLLDFNFSNACNDFVEQLLANTKKCTTIKRKVQLVIPKLEISDDDDLPVSTIALKTNTVIVSTEFQRLNDDSQSCSIGGNNGGDQQLSSIDLGIKQTTCSKLEANDSAITLKSISQDTVYMPNVIQKKISKLDREKMRLHQEKRIAARIRKESSSESENEVNKRKSERLKKPLKKCSKSRSSATTEKKHFSDCGSDTTTDSEDNETTATKSTKKNINNNTNEVQENNTPNGMMNSATTTIEKVLSPPSSNENVIKVNDNENETKEENQKNQHVNIVSNKAKAVDDEESTEAEESEKEDLATKLDEPIVSKRSKQAQDHVSSNKVQYASTSIKNKNSCNSSSSSNMLSKQIRNKQKLHSKMIGLNTMTRSKRKRELELQLANSKVLRNDKVVRNDKVIRNSTTTTTTIIKRKYERKFGNNSGTVSAAAGATTDSKDISSSKGTTSQEFMSTRLRSKNEKHFTITTRGKKNNILTKTKAYNKKKLEIGGGTVVTNKEHQADMFLEVYRYKRALKVPPSLINIKHPSSNQRMSTSLPDLEKQQSSNVPNRKSIKIPKVKDLANTKLSPLPKQSTSTATAKQLADEPKSMIDLLHSRVIKSSVRPKSKTVVKVNASNSSILSHSETSQTTESNSVSELLPTPKKDATESIVDGKKRHFSIFDTKVLQTKTRTESKLQQKKEIIREIFVGDDRPASAPPEMTQTADGGEKMTYEQKYEQFLQQMNIGINEEKLRNFGKAATYVTTKDTAAAVALTTATVVKKSSDLLGTTTTSIKQEEDNESVSAFDADEKLDCDHQQDNVSTISGTTSCFRRRRPGKYLRRKGSSGFDYIRKKKKPIPVSSTQSNNHLTSVSVKVERLDEDYYGKAKTESDVSREIQKWVLNKGVGQSTLHKAARLGYIDVIVYCLDNMGLNPDQKDNAGYTPLHEACTNGWLDIARILLQYGANHSEAAHSGIRPLHEACENDHVEIVRMLLSYGADPLLATYSGQTPLMLASSNSIKEMIQNHLQDVQAASYDRKPWRFNGPWYICDEKQCGFDVLRGAPPCDISRAFRKCNQLSNKKLTQKFSENSSHAISNNCAVQLNKIDHFNSVRSFGDAKYTENIKNASAIDQTEFLIENSNSDGEMFEFEEADVLLPPLYLLKDEGTDKWVLLNDLCNLLKVKSKDTLLNKIYPSSAIPSGHKSLMRELKMSDFLEKATCLQLLCAGEKINVCASKVVLLKYNDNVRNLLGVKTILMKF